MDPITVLIADAHSLLRRQLSKFLAQHGDLQVVGDAADGRRVLSGVAALQPHVLVVDVRKLEPGGLELLRRLRARSPMTRILILTDFIEEDFTAQALQQGAHGCMLKTAPPAELVKAIRTIHAGELWVPRKLLTRVVESLCWRKNLQEPLAEMLEVLTDREHEVVMCAVRGLTNKEIATQLGISAKTVKTHLQHVFRKLNIRRRVQLLQVPYSPPKVLLYRSSGRRTG